MRRLATIAVTLSLAVGVGTAMAASAPASTRRATDPADASGGRWSGAQAIEHLGTRLPQVAAENGLTAAQLRQQLLGDPTLWVDGTDTLFYVERPAPGDQTSSSATTAAAPYPDADTFLLHSRPGSSRVIYLDFDGQLISGTAWNGSTGGDCTTNPFDADGSPGTFSSSERATVQAVWQRVAEDYVPFDVDVTTQDPGFDAINRSGSTDTIYGTRALITNSTSKCPNGKTLYASVCTNGCGGVAYVGVFDNTSSHAYYQPALVFQNGVGTVDKYVAEATSHEVGHNLGLGHDGTTSGCGTTGTSACGYYEGQGSWAPIMGVGYYKAITQWSKGEYALANNTQDDFTVIGSNGALLRADDHGSTAATATALAGTSLSASGVITTRADLDVFSIAAGAGPATFTATPAPRSPNLDIRLQVRNAAGTVVASSDPASGSSNGDTATGMGASISTTLAAGTYTVWVDGVGYGDPATTGYSDYASVGQYTIGGTVTGATNQPPVAAATATPTQGTAPLAVSFSGSGSSDPEGGTLTYSWSFGDGTANGTGVTTSHTYQQAGTFTATLTVTDPAGYSDTDSITITASAPQKYFDVSSMTIAGSRSRRNASATATVTVKDALGQTVGSVTVTGQWSLNGSPLSTKTGTTGSDGVASISSGAVKAASPATLQLCVTGLSLAGYTRDPSLYSAGLTGTDCLSWTG